MPLRHQKPRWPLSDFIDILWLYDGITTTHERERLLPSGTMEIVINLLEDEIRVYDRETLGPAQRFRGAVMIGPHSEYFVIDTAQQTSVAGIHFKPGGGFVFVRPPAGEFHNSHVGLDDVWGGAACEMRERLLEAKGSDEKFCVMEDCLIDRLTRPPARHPAVDYALDHFHGRAGTQTVSQVTEQIGLSPRRFIQLFSDQVGYTPKLFCRIRRFQEVLKSIHRLRNVDWAGVALSCGYFDQAHFVRDFRAFSGINPTSYLATHTEHLNHVPIRD